MRERILLNTKINEQVLDTSGSFFSGKFYFSQLKYEIALYYDSDIFIFPHKFVV